jgi:hypothetical protein
MPRITTHYDKNLLDWGLRLNKFLLEMTLAIVVSVSNSADLTTSSLQPDGFFIFSKVL